MAVRRTAYWLAVVAAAAVTVVGVVAYARDHNDGDPGAVVRAYFTALARGDAPAALSLGDPAAGSPAYLTTAVLRAQLAVAPISDIAITADDGTGSTRTITYSTVLHFAAGARTVSGHVLVRRQAGEWRLAQTAVSVRLDPVGASSRFTIAGTAIPDAAIVLFPAAVPVVPDTPNLRPLAAGVVEFSGPAAVSVGVGVSTSGRQAVLTQLKILLQKCYPDGAPSGAQCPQPPGQRVVPTSVRGSVRSADVDQLTCSVSSNASGAIEVSGSVAMTGSYQHLDDNNIAHTVRGTFGVAVRAMTPSYGKPRLQFEGSS